MQGLGLRLAHRLNLHLPSKALATFFHPSSTTPTSLTSITSSPSFTPWASATPPSSTSPTRMSLIPVPLLSHSGTKLNPTWKWDFFCLFLHIHACSLMCLPARNTFPFTLWKDSEARTSLGLSLSKWDNLAELCMHNGFALLAYQNLCRLPPPPPPPPPPLWSCRGRQHGWTSGTPQFECNTAVNSKYSIITHLAHYLTIYSQEYTSSLYVIQMDIFMYGS